MKRHALVEPTVLLAAFAHATGSLYQLIPSSYEDEVELMDLIMENLSQGQQAVVRLQNAKRGQN